MSNETFQARINQDYYKTKLPYASSTVNPKVNKAYWEDQRRFTEQFKKDLFEELGITNNPKAEKLYSISYDLGHSSGFSEVYNYAQDLVELIQ